MQSRFNKHTQENLDLVFKNTDANSIRWFSQLAALPAWGSILFSDAHFWIATRDFGYTVSLHSSYIDHFGGQLEMDTKID